MYLTNTRPDICFAVNTLSQYLVQPRHVHLIAAKHLMKYLKGSIDYKAILMQIGLEVYKTGKAHQVDVIVWGLL